MPKDCGGIFFSLVTKLELARAHFHYVILYCEKWNLLSDSFEFVVPVAVLFCYLSHLEL